MSKHEFKLPDIGEGIAEAEIAQWRVAVGDRVAEDQPLVDMLTEKAAVELPSPVTGTVIALNGQAGDKAAVGSVLVVIETAAVGEAVKKSVTPVKAGVQSSSKAPPPQSSPASGGGSESNKALASPALRRRAREQSVDLAQVSGSGPRGRITQADFDAHVAKPGRAAPSAPTARDEIKEIKIIGLRRKIGEAMQRSKQRLPHFGYVEELDVTELEALRVHLNDVRTAQQPKFTLLPFLLRALIKVLPEFPHINSRYDDEAGVLRQYSALHAGIAAQTPNGLLVPVVRNAHVLDVWQAAAEIKRLAEAARAGKATREELSGSTITVTSLGALGGVSSTPVINAPEVTIIGVNRMVERPVVLRGQIVVRQCMNLSSSFDHRIVDGYDAARFIQRLKQLLEHPATLFMP